MATGVFTTGQVGAAALPELLRVCRVGGVMVITVKDTVWECGFAAALAALQDAGRVDTLEETAPFVSMPGEGGTAPGRCVAVRLG